MTVLGLLSQGRGSIATISARLAREFPDANFARNSAHNALPRLAAHGYTRLIWEGEESNENVYEITAKGVSLFDAWLHDEAALSVQRDPVAGLLSFTTLEGIPRSIETIRMYEDAAANRYATTHGLLHGLTIKDLANRPDLELERIRLEFIATRWGQQTKRLTVAREKLEHLQSRLNSVDP